MMDPQYKWPKKNSFYIMYTFSMNDNFYERLTDILTLKQNLSYIRMEHT